MPDTLTELTRAFATTFRAMRPLAESGKTRWGDWVSRLAAKLTPIIGRAFATAMGKFSGRIEKGDVESFAAERANATARSVMDTTAEWLGSGRDPENVLSVSRAAACAITEQSYAINMAKARAVKQRGGKIRWRVGGKACSDCRSLEGKSVDPGKQFVAKSGNAVYGPPLHPSCKCKLVESR